jgi:hypothetical protein
MNSLSRRNKQIRARASTPRPTSSPDTSSHRARCCSRAFGIGRRSKAGLTPRYRQRLSPLTKEKAVRDLAESDDPDALMASRLLQVIAGRPQPHLFETSHCASTAFQ